MHVFLMLFLFPFSSALSQPKIGDNEKQTQATEDEHYRIESGHISLNDSEVIILINSTFEVIEDFERQNETGIIEEESTTENPTTKTRRRYQKMRPSKMACRQYSTKEKYLMLEDAGARNQLYMADSPDEASKGFTSLFPEELETTFAADVQAEIDPQFCDSRCERIKSLLDQATRDRTVSRGQQTENKTEIAREREKTRESQTARQSAVLLSDSGPAEVDEGLRTQNSCYLENFIPVGKCSEPGEEGTWTHDQLCSECRGVYMLNRECFPSFFNAVRCNKKELGCIFDTFSHKAHGECHTQSLAFKVLRNRGDTNCEDWIIEQIELPVSCQCMLSKSSWLRSQPPKEL